MATTVTRKCFVAFFLGGITDFSTKYIYLRGLILRTDKCRNAFSIAQGGILRVILRITKLKRPQIFFRVTVLHFKKDWISTEPLTAM
jgi:hypothetical protein